MSVYPPNVLQAAKNLLDNRDLHVLMSYVIDNAKEDILLAQEDKEILEARRKYDALRDVAETIDLLANKG